MLRTSDSSCSSDELSIQPFQIHDHRAMPLGLRAGSLGEAGAGKEGVVNLPFAVGQHFGCLLDERSHDTSPHRLPRPLALAEQDRLVHPVDRDDVYLGFFRPEAANPFLHEGQIPGVALGRDPLPAQLLEGVGGDEVDHMALDLLPEEADAPESDIFLAAGEKTKVEAQVGIDNLPATPATPLI